MRISFKALVEDRALSFELSDLDLPKVDDPNTSMKMGTFDGYSG